LTAVSFVQFIRRQPLLGMGREGAVVSYAAVVSAGLMLYAPLKMFRYLLPVFPLVFVILGRLWADAAHTTWRPTWMTRTATVLLVVLGIEYASVAPRHLTFVNALVGGPSNSWWVTSDGDEGQGLIDLRRWMRRRGVPEITLLYFGTVDPSVYGIAYQPFLWPWKELEGAQPPVIDTDYIGVSSLYLVGLGHRLPTPEGRTKGKSPLVFWRQLQEERPEVRAGWTLFIYPRERVLAAWERWRALQVAPR